MESPNLTLTISISALFTALVTLVAVGTHIIKVSLTLGAYRIKVDTMWDFLLRRAQASGLSTGTLEMNSPLSVSAAGRAAFGDLLIRQMRDFYKTLKPMSDHDLALELERKFGEQISAEVCPPLKANLGECLIAAVILCREPETVKHCGK